MSSFNSTPNFDNLMLQTLMTRLQIRPPNNHLQNTPPLTLEDLLFDPADPTLPDTESESDSDSEPSKTQLAREESKLEKQITRTILSGKSESLKPNSGHAVSIGEHHICVGFHEEKGSGYRVWEWHGHVMLFDEDNGFTPEYIYGNYFERLGLVTAGGDKVDEDDDDDNDEIGSDEKEEKVGSLGLRELIGSDHSVPGRVLHRNMNSGSPRFYL